MRRLTAAVVLVLVATACSSGDGYNQRLSEDRAGSVVDALVDAGAPASQLTAVGFGATQPVAPNETPGGEDDPEGRQQNRRVEIVLAEG